MEVWPGETLGQPHQVGGGRGDSLSGREAFLNRCAAYACGEWPPAAGMAM